MATIKSLPHSFIRFEDLQDAYCPENAPYNLPAYVKHEVKFQFEVEGYVPDTDKIKLGVNGVPMAPDVYAELVNYKYKFTLPFFADPFYLKSFAIGGLFKEYDRIVSIEEFLQLLYDDFSIVATIEDNLYLVFNYSCKAPVEFKGSATGPEDIQESTEVEYFWGQGYVASPYVDIVIPENCSYNAGSPYLPYDVLGPCGPCFVYTLHHEEDDNAVLGSTNSFNKIGDPCFTTLLTYSCNENAFGFSYAGDRENQVRLPFYLSRPNFPQQRGVYINSRGRHKVLTATVEKEYQLQTDAMIELFHQCMAIALNHDNITLAGDSFREKVVEVISSDNYTPDWNNDYDIPTANAKTKVKVAQFGYTNSNCETEDDDCNSGVGEGGCGDPANLLISDIGPLTAHATWDAVTGATAYEIDVATDAETPIRPDGYPKVIDTNSHDFEGLLASQDWTWKVRAICGTEESNWVDGPDFSTTELP
jgi:hypothetical protein